MSVIVMVFTAAMLEGICETYINIVNAIKRKIELVKYCRYQRKHRGGYRADFKTRVRYRLESIYDYLITPK